MITTHSRFYYGHTVTSENNALDFDEGAAELQATLTTGSYSLEDFASEVATALNAAGALTYTVTVDRATRKITIAATGNFTLLGATGTRIGIGVWSLMGFPSTDQSGAASYEGATGSGSQYRTQFILQDYIAEGDWIQAVEATVSKSASGQVEVVNFGQEEFIQANFRYLTDQTMMAGAPIRNVSAVSDFRTFMDYLITKGDFEFMPDEDDTATFVTVLLERTPLNDRGVGYRLKELYDIGLPSFYESGPLVFRVV